MSKFLLIAFVVTYCALAHIAHGENAPHPVYASAFIYDTKAPAIHASAFLYDPNAAPLHASAFIPE